MLEDHWYYIETVINDVLTCKVWTKKEIRLSVSEAYLKWDQKVIVRKNAHKYCKKNFASYEEIIHVVCKSVHIRTLLKDKNCKPHCSLINIMTLLNKKHMWITYSDLINICEKGDVKADTEAYYDDWELKYP